MYHLPGLELTSCLFLIYCMCVVPVQLSFWKVRAPPCATALLRHCVPLCLCSRAAPVWPRKGASGPPSVCVCVCVSVCVCE